MIVLYLSLLFDDVLVCLPFCWCPCMAINVSVQYDGWVSPRHYIVDPMLLPSGNPFKCHEEVLYFQLLIPPKRFDIFSPRLGDAQKV